MYKNKESYVDSGGVFGLSIIKYVTLQKIVAHDFRYDPRKILGNDIKNSNFMHGETEGKLNSGNACYH